MEFAKSGKLKLVFIILICATIGGGIGSYATFYLASKFFLHGVYSGEAAKARNELSALRSLRTGEIDKAIRLLELNVWAASLFLENSKAEALKPSHSDMDDTISLVRKYESEFGLKLGSEFEGRDDDS